MQEFILKAHQVVKDNKLKEYRMLCSEVDTYCLENKNFTGLIEFYESSLRACTNDTEFNQIKIKDLDVFSKEFAEILQNVLVKSRQNDKIKAIYFEYDFDGYEGNGNFFLCEDFSEDDDEWACQFSRDGIVFGPSIFSYMNFDPDGILPNESKAIGELYIDANLLVAALQEIEKIGGIEYPFGFAQHDSAVIVFHSDK